MTAWRRPGEGIVAWICAGVAVGVGFIAMIASQDGFPHPSALVKIASNDPIAALARSSDQHFRFVTAVEHYDGTYYYAMARDPFLLGKAHTLIDQPAYRYGHPLHGWLAGLLSFGQASLVPLALLLLGLIGLGVSGWAASRIAVHYGRTAYGGLLIAVSPGLLYVATIDTTETVGVALTALTLLAWIRERFILAGLLIILLCFDKEQYMMVLLGLVLWELVGSRRRRDRRWYIARVRVKLAAVLTGPLLLSAWYLYVHARLHAWPWPYESGNFGAPFAGWIDTFRFAHRLSSGSFEQAQIGSATPPTLVAIAVLVVLGALAALRMRTVLDGPMLGLAVFTSMQGWRTLLYTHDPLRTTVVAVLFAVAVLLTRGRESGPEAPPSEPVTTPS